jgi:hypothetical protein
MVDTRKAEIFKRGLAQNLKKPAMGFLRGRASLLHVLEEFLQIRAVHRSCPRVDFVLSRTVKSPFMQGDGFIRL